MQESLDASLVRIRTLDGRVVGAGFLVGERHILTCAHVVSQALGLTEHPLETPQGMISLDFPLVPPHTLFTATVVQWYPPQPDGRGDIAGLELHGVPPVGTEVVRFAPAEDVWEHFFRAFGFPTGYDDGVWATGRLLGRQATEWVMIEDVKGQGFAVGPGFSGTPVWDTQLQGVVGMVVAASRPAETKAAFVLPLDVLVAAWPHLEPITRQRVFLSAAPADDDLAARLTADLEARDIVVWTEQQMSSDGYADKEERIRQAIRAAQAVVLVVSSQTRSSRTVKEHLRLADLYQRRLILVWAGDDGHAQPQYYGWRETIWVDAHGAQYTAALDAIEATLSQHRSILALLGSPDAAPEQESRNPYKGLRAFTADDAEDFFGRDRLVDELVKDIGGMLTTGQPTSESERLLTIIGPSGSGKSSVIMAGLLPKLRHGALSGSESWVYLEPMVPGKHPIEALGLTLKPHFPDTSFKTLREDLEDDATRGLHLLATQLVKPRDSKVVLLVDQFEELFTQTESEEERRRFIDLLLSATTEPRGPLLVLLTLRADFYDRPMQYPELREHIQAHLRLVPLMEVQDLRATIEQPAALPDVQLTFEGNLVGDLLFEMQGQVGALPLLQFTLDQLFQHRSGHRLTLSAYRDIGRVKGALSQHAEKTYAALPSEEHRRLARALFVRLIDPGLAEQDTTRRRAVLSEFTLDDPTSTRLLRETIDAFIAARLLTTNEVRETTIIEISHEAVIREWKRLAEWMREAHQDISLQQAISEDVEEWQRRGKPRDRLYRGSQLKEARDWSRRNMPSGNEVAFLHASTAQKIRSVVSMLAVLLLVVSSIGTAVWFLTHPRLPDPTIVTNLRDDGVGSLRWALANAPPGSTITFDASLRGTILRPSLEARDLLINRNLTIRGPGAGILAISAGEAGRALGVSKGVFATISNLTIKGSGPVGGGYPEGGGIQNWGTLTLINSTVSGNTDIQGGGIDNEGTLTLINSTVSSNSSSNEIAAAGGILNGAFNANAQATLINSTISGNTALADDTVGTGYAGGIENDATLTLINSTVSGNSASTAAGGIENNATLTLINSTVSGNSASTVGGGILNQGTIYNNQRFSAQVDLTFSTVYGNRASVGADIAVKDGSYSGEPPKQVFKPSKQFSQVKIRNSIVVGDPAHSSPDIAGTLTSYGYNLFQYNSGATFDLAKSNLHSTDKTLSVNDLPTLFADPVGLRDNGGPTWTYKLGPHSPALDQVPLQYCQVKSILNSQSRMYSDQRGMKRPDENESACDIGAYEYVDLPT